MASRLEAGDWAGVAHHADALDRYLGEETTRWSRHYVNRSRAIADVRRGAATAETAHMLNGCLAYAEEQRLQRSAALIREAMAQIGA